MQFDHKSLALKVETLQCSHIFTNLNIVLFVCIL